MLTFLFFVTYCGQKLINAVRKTMYPDNQDNKSDSSADSTASKTSSSISFQSDKNIDDLVEDIQFMQRQRMVNPFESTSRMCYSDPIISSEIGANLQNGTSPVETRDAAVSPILQPELSSEDICPLTEPSTETPHIPTVSVSLMRAESSSRSSLQSSYPNTISTAGTEEASESGEPCLNCRSIMSSNRDTQTKFLVIVEDNWSNPRCPRPEVLLPYLLRHENRFPVWRPILPPVLESTNGVPCSSCSEASSRERLPEVSSSSPPPTPPGSAEARNVPVDESWEAFDYMMRWQTPDHTDERPKRNIFKRN